MATVQGASEEFRLLWFKWLVFAAALLFICAAVVTIVGAWRWTKETRALFARLEVARVNMPGGVFRVEALKDLPPPVQRYLSTALRDGQPLVRAVRVTHAGTFSTSEKEDWNAFRSNQRVVIHRPGFVWNARVALPLGLPVNVHDAYVAGEGILRPTLFGLLSLGEQHGGGEIARGELLRFLAEAAWYPTALLPAEGVRWQAIDDHSARATLVDGEVTVSLTFRFNDQNLIESVRAEERGRTLGERVEQLPWQGRFWNYVERDGMRVPLEGEVAWVTPAGPQPYWRGKIETIDYEFER